MSKEIVSVQVAQLWTLVRETAALFGVYYERFSVSGFAGNQPYLAAEIEKKLKARRAPASLTDPLADAYAQVAALGAARADLERVAEILDEHRFVDEQRGTHMSSGARISDALIGELDKNWEACENTVAALRAAWHQLLDAYVAALGSTVDTAAAAALYQAATRAGDGLAVTPLQVGLLQARLDAMPPGDVVRDIMAQLEELKTAVLATGGSAAKTNRKRNLIQTLIQRFNLTPDGAARPLKEQLTRLGINRVPSSAASWAAAAVGISSAERRVGFLVWNKVAPRPIEHLMTQLLVPGYAGRGGVSRAVLARTTTLRLCVDDGLKAKDQELQVYMPKDCTHVYCLETLDGVTYRFLQPWAGDTPAAVPAAWLVDLTERAPSRRLAGYNAALEEAISAALQEPLQGLAQLSRDEARREDNYWKILRGKLSAALWERLTGPFAGAKRLVAALEVPALWQGWTEDVTGLISADLLTEPPSPTVASLLRVELAISYLPAIERLTRGTRRDLITRLQDADTAEWRRALAATGPEQTRLLRAVLLPTIDDVLERYVNRRSGLYLAFENKMDLLQKTVLQ